MVLRHTIVKNPSLQAILQADKWARHEARNIIGEIMSLIIFIFILSILILVHEWGHFITARKCGVKVEQFAFGFGPKLFGWVHDGTEFCLCAIPLGGFVKMAGDEREKCSGSSDEYFTKSAGQRALIILMGPVVNLILAYRMFLVCVYDRLCGHGPFFPESRSGRRSSIGAFSGTTGRIEIRRQDLEHQRPGHRALDRSCRIMVSTSTAQSIDPDHRTRQAGTLAVAITPQETDQQDIFGRHAQDTAYRCRTNAH